MARKEATCTEDGNISYYYCEGCGWYFRDGAHPGTTWFKKGEEVIPATGHSWGEATYTWADDNSKVTDHHAIIPTGQRPEGLTADEKTVYDLVALHFIAVFYPECEVSNTTVLAKAGDVDFKVT